MKRKGDMQEKGEMKKPKFSEGISQCKTQQELEKFSCPDLKEYLAETGLAKTGNKPALVARVFHHLCMSNHLVTIFTV